MTTDEGETFLQSFCKVMGETLGLVADASRHIHDLSNEERQNIERVKQEMDRIKVLITKVIDNESDCLVQQLLKKCNQRSESVLHYACKYNLPIEIVTKLIEKGDQELLLMKCARSKTALHYACKTGADSLEIVNALIDAGGKELVMQKTFDGETALFDAVENDAPMEVISRLLEEGDDDILFQTNTHGQNVLQVVSGWPTSSDTIRELIRLGGKELVMTQSTTAFGITALDQICMNTDIPIDIISMLIDIGGKELVMMKRGKHFVTVWFECVYMEEPEERRLPENTQRLILLFCALASPNEGDEEDIYEFGIGNLYGDFDSIGRQAWDEVWVPAIQEVHQQYPNAPLLHAALIHESKPFVIKDLVTRFDDSMILVKDSHKRYPIDIAIGKGLQWEDGMKEIFDKFTSIQQATVQNKLLFAIRHSMKWKQGMKYILKESKEHISSVDRMTNLYPFMLAASEQKCDLDSVFNLIQANPHLVKKM